MGSGGGGREQWKEVLFEVGNVNFTPREGEEGERWSSKKKVERGGQGGR